MKLALFLYTYAPIIASSSDDNEAALAPLLFLLSGFIFYGIMYARYRNADKRHYHEKETSAVVANLQVGDALLKNMKGLSNSSMPGANQSRVEGALNQGSGQNILLDAIKPKQ